MDMLYKNKMRLVFGIMIIPFLLMFILHIGIALGNYFSISINVESISSKDWFMFFASYLGGTMTLIGVLFSISYERKVQQYNNVIQDIDKEKIQLSILINKLDVFLPTKIIKQFASLPIQQEGYNSNDIAVLRKWIADELAGVFKSKREMLLLTYICSTNNACNVCANKCDLVTVKPQFEQLYNKIADEIYALLQEIDVYIDNESSNIRYKCLIILCKQRNGRTEQLEKKQKYIDEIKEYQSKIVDTKEQLDSIMSKCTQIAQYNAKEMWELNNLAISYISIRKQNAWKIIEDK